MKKLISLILIFVLCLSLIPAAHGDSLDVYLLGMIARSKAGAIAGTEMSYSRVGDLVFVSFAIPSMASVVDAIEAEPAGGDYHKMWDELLTGLVDELQPILDEARQYGTPSCCIFYSMMSDRDPGVILASVTEGAVIYDAIYGAHDIIQIKK